MADLFKGAREQLREDGKVAFTQRTFRIALLGTNPQAKVDTMEDATMDDVYDNHRENARAGDVAVRTQVIGDPTKPFGIRDRIMQFFVVESSRDTVRSNLGSGVLYEMTQDGNKPLAYMDKDDLTRAINGEGFAITQPYDPAEPASAPPVSEMANSFAAQAAQDKDANAVPDAREYVGGDPDKGVLASAGVQRVEMVNSQQEAKPGTVTSENLKAAEQAPQGGAPAQAPSGTPPVDATGESAPDQGTADEDEVSDEERAALDSELGDDELEGGEEDVEDISTLTKPSVLAGPDFGVSDLKEYARANDIEVTRRDGEGAPMKADYARAIASFNRKTKKQRSE